MDRTILHLKAQGSSNRVIAGRIGVDERTIRRHLSHLGWVEPEPSSQSLLLPSELPDPADADVSIPGTAISLSDDATPESEEKEESEEEDSENEPMASSFDVDPLNRSIDRLLASMGVLEDAAPLFASAASVPKAGVLLAIPALVSSGLLTIARKVYGSLGLCFLRTEDNTGVLRAAGIAAHPPS